ncbi:MAG: hypothetical protein V4461_15540, partial [Pseudomonadota bacterium]
AGSSSGQTSIVPTAAASGVLTLPAATDQLVGRATTDTLTNKTLTAPVITAPIYTPNAPVAATGSALASAAQVNNGFTVVTASDGTKCVKLPATPTPGMLVTLFNSVAGQPLIIFPDAAATINAIGSHGALTCANTVPVMLYATSATQWYSLPLLPS